MLLGVSHIHAKGFAHRDLKPDNIMLDHNYDIKIVDLGLTSRLEGDSDRQDGFCRQFAGTPEFIAPEVMMRADYLPASTDIFALGVTLFYLASGWLPFRFAHPEKDPFYKMLVETPHKFWDHMSRCGLQTSEEFKSLVTMMLEANPSLRIDLPDIVGDPWLLGPFPDTAAVL